MNARSSVTRRPQQIAVGFVVAGFLAGLVVPFALMFVRTLAREAMGDFTVPLAVLGVLSGLAVGAAMVLFRVTPTGSSESVGRALAGLAKAFPVAWVTQMALWMGGGFLVGPPIRGFSHFVVFLTVPASFLALVVCSTGTQKHYPRLRAVIWGVLVAGAIGLGVVYLRLTSVPSPDELLPPLSEAITPEEIPANDSSSCNPILVVTEGNALSAYVTEILRAEGVTAFDIRDLAQGVPGTDFLSRYRLIITTPRSGRLADMTTTIANYVGGGGRLFMMSPPAAYDSLLGLHDEGAVTDAGDLTLDVAKDICRGWEDTSLQVLGDVRLCSAPASDVIAWLKPRGGKGDCYAGMGIRSLGRGKIAYSTANVGESVVFMRQGTPPGVVEDADGDGVFRTGDLFARSLDTTRLLVPQADMVQRFFLRVLDSLLSPESIIPRLWYFPDAEPAIALLTGDAHNTPVAVVDSLVHYIETRGGRFSLIEYPTGIDTAYAREMIRRGNSIAPHLYYPRHDNGPMRFRQQLARGFSENGFHRPRFADVNGEITFGAKTFEQRLAAQPLYTRMHFLTWWGWDEIPRAYAREGIGMDLSVTGVNPHRFFELPDARGLKSPTGYGYANGSGLPMRYISRDGRMLDVYSQLTQVEDDVIAAGFVAVPPNDSISVRGLTDVNCRLIDESVDRYHTALVYNFHPQHAIGRFPKQAPPTWAWVTATVDHLAERHVPMLTVDAWLRFIRARSAVRVQSISHDLSRRNVAWEASAKTDLPGLTFVIPVEGKKGSVAVTAHTQGGAVPFKTRPGIVAGRSVVYVVVDMAAHMPIHIECTFHE